MRRKVLVLLLTLTLVLSFMPMIAFADVEAEEQASVNETIEEEDAQDEAAVDETELKDEAVSSDATAADEDPSDDLSQEDKRTEINGESTLEGMPQQIENAQALNASADDEDNEEPSECNHEKTHTKEVRDRNKAAYESLDDAKHKVSGPVEITTYCDDCGKILGTETVEKEDVEYHKYDNYDSKVCVYCDHYNTCEHLSRYYEYDYDKDKCKIVDCGINHEVTGTTGTIEKVEICKICEKILGREEENKTVQEIHYYHGGDVCVYCGHDKNRIFGKARYDTAIGVADRYKETSGSKFENVIVADGRNYPDALSGGYLAKVRNAPILLVAPSEEDRIANYISKSIASNGTVYILGGTGAVSSAFEKRIENKRLKAVRLGGKDRYETNLNIMKAAGVKDENILVCTGSGYADSLSASAVGKPILLVGDTLTDTQKEYIEGLITKQFYLIGGTGAVTTKIETDLKNLGDYNITRLAGSTRYDTSTKVAKKFFPKATTVVLAYAQNFPDGLSGGPLAMLEGAPIVLTDSNHTTAAKTYIKSAGAIRSITLGGTALISDIAVKTIMGKADQ